MNKNMITVIASVLLSGLTAFGIVKANQPAAEQNAATTTYSIDGSAYRTVNLAQDNYPDFTYAAESAVDAVVFVKVTIKSTQEYYIDPFFKFFFGDQMPQEQEREQQGSGSGVIIRQDGYIVTNNHVVQGATKIEVTLNNNKTYEAKVIGTDPATDVALIKIDADGLPIVPIADSDKLRLVRFLILCTLEEPELIDLRIVGYDRFISFLRRSAFTSHGGDGIVVPAWPSTQLFSLVCADEDTPAGTFVCCLFDCVLLRFIRNTFLFCLCQDHLLSLQRTAMERRPYRCDASRVRALPFQRRRGAVAAHDALRRDGLERGSGKQKCVPRRSLSSEALACLCTKETTRTRKRL